MTLRRDKNCDPSAVRQLEPVASSHWRVVLLIASCFAMILGCGDGLPQRARVSGRVMIDGEPLTHGIVRFVPYGARMSTGRLDDQGRFQLTCFESGDGAVIGDHRIAILSQEPIGQAKIKWHAPSKYASAGSSGLVETIEGPIEDLVIDLTWGGKKGPYVQELQKGAARTKSSRRSLSPDETPWEAVDE